MVKTSWLSENADELAALILIVGGLYMAIFKNYQEGVALISLGTAYLFGKNPPKTKAPQGGLPYGQ